MRSEHLAASYRYYPSCTKNEPTPIIIGNTVGFKSEHHSSCKRRISENCTYIILSQHSTSSVLGYLYSELNFDAGLLYKS